MSDFKEEYNLVATQRKTGLFRSDKDDSISRLAENYSSGGKLGQSPQPIRSLRKALFMTAEERQERKLFMEKREAYHHHEMTVGKIISKGLQEDVQIQVDSALSHKRLNVDAHNKALFRSIQEHENAQYKRQFSKNLEDFEESRQLARQIDDPEIRAEYENFSRDLYLDQTALLREISQDTNDKIRQEIRRNNHNK
jgi:hypothetical protein